MIINNNVSSIPYGSNESPESKKPKTEKEMMEEVSAFKDMLYDKIIHNDTEPKYQIGASEFTEKDWKKLLESFDDVEEQLYEEAVEHGEEMEEKKMAEIIAKKQAMEAAAALSSLQRREEIEAMAQYR